MTGTTIVGLMLAGALATVVGPAAARAQAVLVDNQPGDQAVVQPPRALTLHFDAAMDASRSWILLVGGPRHDRIALSAPAWDAGRRVLRFSGSALSDGRM